MTRSPGCDAGHVRADGGDHTGAFAAEAAQSVDEAEGDDDVPEVHTGGAYVDPYLAGTERCGKALGGRDEGEVVDGGAVARPVEDPRAGPGGRQQRGVAGEGDQPGRVDGAPAQREPGFRERHGPGEHGGRRRVTVPVDDGDPVGVLVRGGTQQPPHGGGHRIGGVLLVLDTYGAPQ